MRMPFLLVIFLCLQCISFPYQHAWDSSDYFCCLIFLSGHLTFSTNSACFIVSFSHCRCQAGGLVHLRIFLVFWTSDTSHVYTYQILHTKHNHSFSIRLRCRFARNSVHWSCSIRSQALAKSSFSPKDDICININVIWNSLF